MIFSIIVCLLTILFLIFSVIAKPSIRMGKIHLQTFWIVSLIGAVLIVAFGNVPFTHLKDIFMSNESMNPLEILILFISMSVLSIALDEAGFFRRCAYLATRITKTKQYILFLSLSLVVSILTVFTSNDIIILTFTPFICYFSKHAKINPIPYLIAEYVYANTWSMLFIIGNPTNIFLATSFEISFIQYFKIMTLPTIASGIAATILLLLLFRKDLKKPLDVDDEIECPKLNPFLVAICLIHLVACTIFLVISSYVKIAMWIVSFAFAMSLSVFLLVYYIIRKEKTLFKVYKRAPWNLIPFVLSMYVIVASFDNSKVILRIAEGFDKISVTNVASVYSYGVSSFLLCNFLNNIPMSVMMEKVILESSHQFLNASIYSTIIASNIGAYFTPIGALAGIMWMSILHNTGLKFGFKQFVKYGVIISSVVILVALSILALVL